MGACLATAIKGRKMKSMWRGGRVAPSMQDDDLSVMNPTNTSGEPHTDDLDEEDHPMEFMADGGEVDSEGYEEGEETPDSTYDHAIRFFDALKRRPKIPSSY